MDAKIIGLRGWEYTPKGEPVKEIVASLEVILELAKAGQIRAMGIAYIVDDGTAAPLSFTDFRLESGQGRVLDSAAMTLSRRIQKWLDE